MALNNFFFQGQAGVPMAMDQMPRSIEEAAQINRVIAQMVGQQTDASMPQGGPPGPTVPRDRILEMAQYEKTHPGMLSGGMPSQSRSAYGQRPQMPMGQNAGLDRMRTANANFASDQQQPQIPPQIARMLQQQTIDSQLPQNRPQLSPEQLGAPQGLDERRNTPADPTGFAARMSIGGPPPPDYQPQPINDEQKAQLANLVASLQSQERPGFDSPTVLSGGGNAAMAGTASRLASMPGAQEADIPGLAGSDNVTPGAGVRELWSRPGFQAAEQSRETEQARRHGIVSDRARMKADMRDGITPQMRLIDQMTQGGGQVAGGAPDDFTRNAILYGPDVAARMVEANARNNIAKGELALRGREVGAQELLGQATLGNVKNQQRAAEMAIATGVSQGDPSKGSYTDLTDSAAKKAAILGVLKANNNRWSDTMAKLQGLGIPIEDVYALVGRNLPAPTASFGDVGRHLLRGHGIDTTDPEEQSRNAYLGELNKRMEKRVKKPAVVK